MSKSSKPVDTKLPKWWLLVNTGINAAIAAGRKTYDEPGVILGEIHDSENNLEAYVVRDRSRTAKLLNADFVGPKGLTIGSKIIHGKLPLIDMDDKAVEPTLNDYIHKVITKQVHTIPKLWLRKTIKNRLAGAPMTEKDYRAFQVFDTKDLSQKEIDFRIFQKWILVPLSKRGNRPFNEMLLRVLEVGGLKYLSKFNFIFKEFTK